MFARAARHAVRAGSAIAGAATLARVCHAEEAQPRTQLRSQDFPLAEHYHGKTRVRVLKVRRDAQQKHLINEYSVQTKLFSPDYEKVFIEGNNEGLVATDTQKNTVYVVAKRTEAATPEEFGISIAEHFMSEYPMLTGVEIEVKQTQWLRASIEGEAHDHAFVKGAAELASASVRLVRGRDPEVTSRIDGMTVLKTTQSGFEKYLFDQYTLLPPTRERCLATEMDASWTYAPGAKVDYAATRKLVTEQLLYGLFGPARGGVYSESLQATIYDAGCLVLKAIPAVASISMWTPNLHYLPYRQLSQLGEAFADDIFTPTNEPSGTIHCTVAR
eukprot:CAMPEP_0183340774 /NCGR_PEP_ID=MMETSP0164_2-20130417/7208_1 /TAXON_ID=221442 /ORGANISM="Coccolithus pelagicus ssp braarudi, Strain PLY182g" /LENGTH=329 /DNA_ID=CAMNT_0025510959 /DNA_START=38 /DNA_END=1027 /DNA_ORIENTATION=-